jgi:hypothetical protein
LAGKNQSGDETPHSKTDYLDKGCSAR